MTRHFIEVTVLGDDGLVHLVSTRYGVTTESSLRDWISHIGISSHRDRKSNALRAHPTIRVGVAPSARVTCVLCESRRFYL